MSRTFWCYFNDIHQDKRSNDNWWQTYGPGGKKSKINRNLTTGVVCAFEKCTKKKNPIYSNPTGRASDKNIDIDPRQCVDTNNSYVVSLQKSASYNN